MPARRRPGIWRLGAGVSDALFFSGLFQKAVSNQEEIIAR
ncbi:hypothetical protein GDI2963 [Gluconacetobacter diazotrophicus PA1 5]|uniref:Uncharacterized protein n=1 Tax=Gluconacetobacter diazotrophicus (strain ATCC 49037 / DSM 5601 / CCUG 37298 / CIP 103539 / LMG 7603 / PAl5) TaxID=272568 RepID=A9HRG6_GLUDA|nr:hypothetical protein GDI2963 [Gluconacetobacter diazotrophicus PA1 5]